MLAYCFIIGCSLIAAVHCQADCSILPDGDYNVGCKSYEHCSGGVHSTIECHEGQVYNNDTQGCDDQEHVGAPCGLKKNCNNIPDGSYTDLKLHCESYYTCNGGVYFGHNFCTPGTVFEQSLGTCVWPADAYPPCGTKHATTAATS